MRTIAISAFAIVGSLLVLFNLLSTSAFSDRAPQGAEAMGLIVPLGFSIVAALAFLIATLVALTGGRLDWIDPRPGVTAAVAVLVAVGIGAAIITSLVVWDVSYNRAAALFGQIAGGAAPFLLAVILVMSRESAASGTTPSPPVPRALAMLLVPIAMVGIAVALTESAKGVRASIARSEAAAEAEAEFNAKWEKIRNRPPVEAAREDIAALNSTAPLWVVIQALPETELDEVRKIVVDRGLLVPDLDEDIAGTLTSGYPRYRHASLEFIKWMDSARRQKVWAPFVAQAIDTTVAEMRDRPDWFEPNTTRNSRPLNFVRLMVESASWFPENQEIPAALPRLRDAITALPASASRDSALALFTK